MYKLFFILSTLCSILFSSPLGALEVSPIIIKAEKIQTQMNKVSSNVKVITQEEISEYTQLDELLAHESDISLARSGPKGSVSSIFMRGTDSAHTLVIIDGIVMNDPSNPNRQFDIGRLSLNNIEQIEIIKGSQGVLYGANAIGGVIFITSKGSSAKTTTTTSLDYGSYNTINAGVALNKNFDDAFLALSLDAITTDGYSSINDPNRLINDKDGYKRLNFHGQLKKDLANNAQMQLVYRRTHDQFDIDKNNYTDDPNDHYKTKEEYYKIGLTQSFEHSDSEFGYTSQLNERRLFVLPDEFSPEQKYGYSLGENKTMSFSHTKYWNDLFTQVYQVEYQNESMKMDQAKIEKNDNLSYLIYSRFNWNEHVLNLGLRLDDNKIFNNSINYTLSHLVAFEKFLLRSNFSSGLKSPSLNQLLDPTYGNTELRSEKSLSYDIGLEYHQASNQKLVTSFFETYIRDRHSYDAAFKNINDGKAKISGIETSYEIFMTQNLRWQNSYTWIEAYNTSSSTRLLRRPTHSWSSLVTYKIDLQRFSLEGRYIGTKHDYNQSFNVDKTASYIYFNFFYNYDLNNNLTASFKLNNIFNKKYEEVIGYNNGLRSASVGLKYQF